MTEPILLETLGQMVVKAQNCKGNGSLESQYREIGRALVRYLRVNGWEITRTPQGALAHKVAQELGGKVKADDLKRALSAAGVRLETGWDDPKLIREPDDGGLDEH